MLDKDTLGTALYNVRQLFNEKTKDELLMMYTTIDNARLALCKKEAEAIINHFKSNGIILPGTFTNSGGPVTGSGTIQ